MSWFKVDDKLHDHRKARRAKKAAMGVWVLAGSWCSDNGTGGFVPESVLERWGNRRDAAVLVEVGFWSVDHQDGEDGWRFHEWDIRNPDAASHLAKREAESAGGVLGNHKRWHEKRNITVPDCPYCKPSGTRSGAIGEPDSPPNPPVPVPSRPVSVVKVSSQSQTEPRGVTSDGLDRIKKLTRGTEAHARKCAEFVLAKAPADVRNPDAYVIAAISEAPDEFRHKRGNPKKGEECPTHAGQWADACAGCAADSKAAS